MFHTLRSLCHSNQPLTAKVCLFNSSSFFVAIYGTNIIEFVNTKFFSYSSCINAEKPPTLQLKTLSKAFVMTIKQVQKRIVKQMKICSRTRQGQTQRHTTIDIREINLQLTLTMTMALWQCNITMTIGGM